MNTYFFSEDGRCVCVANYDLETSSLDEGIVAVKSAQSLSPDEIYFDGGIKFSQEFDLSISANIISGIPTGATAYINGVSYLIDDGILEVTGDYPSLITVILTHPHYRTAVIEVQYEG